MLEKISGSTPIDAGPEAVIADICRAVETLREALRPGWSGGHRGGRPGAILRGTGRYRRVAEYAFLQRVPGAVHD